MRVPSAGRSLSGALVRSTIQCASSQCFAGRVKFPANSAPAWRRIVSPQAAFSIAAPSSPEFFTRIDLPGVGVSDNAVFTDCRGNSAGPSNRPGSAFACAQIETQLEKENSSRKKAL